ncbi:MAG: hypothetical protein KDM64_05595 [Verrucomicrobiae bacterium]|nr:hypothetical protein [Verrucomicrobiae bacterium]
MRSPTLFLLTILFATVLRADRGLAQTPGVAVENIRRAFHNGEHNAFTDLIRWHDRFWLTFRSCPDGHMVSSTASVIVLSSEDAQTWREEFRFSVPKRDTRDPHFLSFQDKLFVFTGTWYSGEGKLPMDQYDINKQLGFAVWTEDGKVWQGPRQMEGTYGHYIWKAAERDGMAYLCGRRKAGYSENESGAGGSRVMEGALLVSEDGFNWTFRSLFQETMGNETAFLFQSDGSLLALSRESSDEAQIATSVAPFLEWKRERLPEHIGGPLLARWGDKLVIGGRRNTPEGKRTALYWLDGTKLIPFAQLPSDGDNSYPGFVDLGGGKGLVSWYSSHEKDADGKTITAIYLADLEMEP